MGFFNKKKDDSVLPVIQSRKTLHKNLKFTATEQYKLLRANLRFTLPEGERCPVIGITSSMRGEGKSTTAINLAYVLAENGGKVALIDGDLRLPSIARKMRIKSVPGLTNLLMRKHVPIEKFQSSVTDNLYVIPSGPIPPNPSELLGSDRMKMVLEDLKKEFDCIIIDLPPVNIVSDALSVSELISGIIVVIREGYTEKKELEHCFRQLKLSSVNILGFVMNESKSNDGSYSKYKKNKYYRYSSYYRKKTKKVESYD
jgi:capsular exopolysaccharide synthesis family protein